MASRSYLLVLALLGSASRADWTVTNLSPAGYHDVAIFAVTPGAQFGEGLVNASPSSLQPLGWHGSASSVFTLGNTPPVTGGGSVYAASSDTQAGQFGFHAALWHSTPESRIDLHPAGYFLSEARAVSGPHQFGRAQPAVGAPFHAAAWSGSASSRVDMNPPGALSSSINAAWGALQGGAASFDNSAAPARAGLWSGTPSSFVSVHPGGAYSQSAIAGMAEGEQVGQAMLAANGSNHACLWHGTAESFVDLDPGAGLSVAFATTGGVQVGYVYTGGVTWAALWFGTASSFLNLGQFLPPSYYDSRATSIASDGAHYFVGGYATSPVTGYSEAFLWVGTVPAPSALALLAGAGGVLAVRRRR